METPAEESILGHRYKLVQTIGSGGMAVVYRAQDMMLERPVAIKVLRQDFSSDPSFRDRFHLEAKAAANLSHPNIVTVHDFGLDNHRLYLVMEFIPGTDLKTILKQRGRLPVNEAIDLMVQACAGIGYAHRAGLVHCDIKPQNILVTPDQRLKITDFGIARALASIHPDEHSDVIWGSPQYFSPEQASGLAPSPASDVYSLGVVFYEMLTGRLPFDGQTATELAKQHRDSRPTPPRKYNPSIPVEVEQIVLKILSKEPSSRYRTANQLGRVLSTILQSPEIEHPGTPAKHIQLQKPTEKMVPVSQSQPTTTVAPLPKSSSIDWGTILLALLATITVGGLIPFWLFIWLTLRPPG
jgi:serine/threonine-protein kinase